VNFRPSEADRGCSYRKGAVEAEDDRAWWRRNGRTEERKPRKRKWRWRKRRKKKSNEERKEEEVVSDRAGTKTGPFIPRLSSYPYSSGSGQASGTAATECPRGA